MDKHQFSKKPKKKKEKVENLYKILGTRSNISQERIKEKYIEKVKEFPPETHPEEFQEIRKAYEILKDVKKRKQYDMMRKYGDKIEKAMEDVERSMEIGDYGDAKKLLEYIVSLNPDNIAIKLKLAEVLLELEEFKEFNLIIDEVLEMYDDEDKEYIIFIKFYMLNSKGYNDMALDSLEQGKKYLIKSEYHKLRIIALTDLGDFNQAWKEFKYAFPSTEDVDIDDLNILIIWLNTAIELEKWGEISKIIQKNYG